LTYSGTGSDVWESQEIRVIGKRLILCFLTGLVLLALTGCIRSRFLATTEPPGATISFQRQIRGEAPIEIPFIWYWFYQVRVEKEGYKMIVKNEYFPAPPWFIMPLDLIAEMIPVPIHNTHRRHYVLEPIETAAESVPAEAIQ